MDYAMPSFRKTKRDKRAKARYRIYKTGGVHRTSNIPGKQSECGCGK